VAADNPNDAEAAALVFLAAEVPKWSKEHHCFSCHNNGDGARALFRAIKQGRPVPANALADTSQFLLRPEQWDHNGPEGPFSDRVLARIQFAAALAEARDSREASNAAVLIQAADPLVQDQRPDGSWSIEGAGGIGSPAAYGPAIATWLARRTLHEADPQRFAAAVAKADGWFLGREVQTVLDAAATLLALQTSADPAADRARQRSLDLIRRGESREGGWGPYVTSPPEAFDTAVVLLALADQAEKPDIRAMITRGRSFVAKSQEPDGGWPPTTRPPGGESYAQRLSTTGWATLALITTRLAQE
jgi:hypothetical protein